MAKVKRDHHGHWLWQAHLKTHTGYGEFTLGGRRSSMPAHRAAWVLFVGPIPEGVEIHHACPGGPVRSCVNPCHLELATPKENSVERSTRNGRKTVCKHGHPMEGDNVGWTTRANGRTDRYCRQCALVSNRAQYAKHREKRLAWAREVGAPRRMARAQHVKMSVSTDSE